MTYHILYNSTTADSSDINDNFYHIGQGSRFPFGGSILGNTYGTINIGESTDTWKTLYCNTLYVKDTVGTISVISRQIISSTTERIEFTGLPGSDLFYFLNIQAKYSNPTSTGYNYLNFGGVSSNIYWNMNMKCIGNTTTVNAYNTWTQTGGYVGEYINGVTTTTQYCESSVFIIIYQNISSASEYVKYSAEWTNNIGNYVYSRENNSGRMVPGGAISTITSLSISGRFDSGSIIELLAMR